VSPGERIISNRERRRFLVHLFCAPGGSDEICGYTVRIRPYGARNALSGDIGELTFTDDRELIAAINPLLPSGSDVRDIFGHIESPNGFFYLLELSDEQARSLGWQGR